LHKSKGIVKTKAEAIRLGLLQLDKSFNLNDNVSLDDVIVVNKKIKQELIDIKKNNEKWYNLEELKKEFGVDNGNKI
jgi:hypothetical protein